MLWILHCIVAWLLAHEAMYVGFPLFHYWSCSGFLECELLFSCLLKSPVITGLLVIFPERLLVSFLLGVVFVTVLIPCLALGSSLLAVIVGRTSIIIATTPSLVTVVASITFFFLLFFVELRVIVAGVIVRLFCTLVLFRIMVMLIVR